MARGAGRILTAYERLAAGAARDCGLSPATGQACAENERARDLRDRWWAEFDRRLDEVQTYTIDQIVDWGARECKVRLVRSAVYRCRLRSVAHGRAIEQRAAIAREVADTLGSRGELDALRAGRGVATQLIFEALQGLSPEALSDLKPGEVLRLINTLGALSRSTAEVELNRARTAELERRFDAEVAARTATAAGGQIGAADIEEIRRAVFGAPTG